MYGDEYIDVDRYVGKVWRYGQVMKGGVLQAGISGWVRGYNV